MEGINARITTAIVELYKVPLVREVLSLAGEYEVLITKFLAENERLKGKMEGLREGRFNVAGGLQMSAPSVVSGSTMLIQKPVETWAAKVMSSDKGMTGKEVVRKVMKEVDSQLNVRVH